MPIRPEVVVYQEVASPTVTPTIPDLQCVCIGVASWIQDYWAPGAVGTTYADKSVIQVASYGTLFGNPATALPSGPAYITVASPPNITPGGVLNADSVTIFFDQAEVVIDAASTGTTTASSNVFTSSATTWATPGTDQVLPGDTLIVSDGTHTINLSVYQVTDNTHLLLTSDIPSSGFTPGSAQTYRIERKLLDQQVPSSYVTVIGNSVMISGGVELPVPGQGMKPVDYALVYEAYTALRTDLTVLNVVAQESDILTQVGRIDSRNPLAAALFVALQNTTTQVQYVGVTSDDLVGYTAVRDAISARSDVYAIVPLTTDVPTLEMWNADCVERAIPDETNGYPQKFRVVIGSGVLPTIQTMASPSATGVSSAVSGTSPGTITAITLTGVANLITGGVIPTDILNVTVTSVAGTVAVGMYTIATVETLAAIQVNSATPFAGAGTCNITAEILEADGVTVRIASAALTGVVVAADATLYLQLTDASGSFISSGVAAGDIVQIPSDPNATITSTSVLTNLVVAQVQSNQRLLIVNNGQDQSTTVNELPHGVKRIGGALVTLTAINYQIIRNTNQTQQVTNLVALAQSFNSSRTLLVWPDKCDVAGVTNGTGQPGYYLAAGVGGMTAGLPAQQGFTNLGMAGISQIYDSNGYFNDTELTNLSNGGWYVMAQATTTSLPYCVHQLTTDVQTLESGEYSIVKDFDFVSVFFVEIMQSFLGVYNLTSDTLTLLQNALNTGGDLLKLRTVAKIGAPLTSFSVTSVAVSTVSPDRAVAYLAVGLPYPLNIIELHLVA
jgi:hypothetical protein